MTNKTLDYYNQNAESFIQAQYVTFAYVDDHTPVIYETAAFTNDRQKLSLSVEKKDSETDELITGAVFGLYADEDIRNVDGKVIIEAGTLRSWKISRCFACCQRMS